MNDKERSNFNTLDITYEVIYVIDLFLKPLIEFWHQK